MKILIWGTGNLSRMAIDVAEQLEWDIEAFIDSNIEKQNQLYCNRKVIAPSEINTNEYKECIILVGTANDEVAECVKKYNNPTIPFEKLNKIYCGCERTPDYFSYQLMANNLKNCHLLSDRLELLNSIKRDFDNKIFFAEIGVAFGDYSKEILKRCSPYKLYLIDMWEGERYEKGYEAVKEAFSEEIDNGEIEILRGYSTEKLKEIEDDSLDVAYIDTVHDYDTTWEELLLCKDKVKDTGYIAGHDYVKYNHVSRKYYGVYDAVNRFAVQYKYEFIYITMEMGGLHSFCLRKIK